MDRWIDRLERLVRKSGTRVLQKEGWMKKRMGGKMGYGVWGCGRNSGHEHGEGKKWDNRRIIGRG